MTKEVLMQEVKHVADLLKVDYSNLSDVELFSMVTGVTVASFDEVTEDRLAFLYKLIPGGAFVDSTDESSVEGEDEEPTVDDDEPVVDPVADDDEPTVAPVADDEEPEVEPEEVEDDEKSEATVEE